MIISYQWLQEYLPHPVAVDELSRILTSIGLEVEAIEKAEAVKGGLEGLVIGEVLTCEPHPNADKLKVTTVNTGSGETLNIVCGAPNVAAGQKVVVATVGTTVHPSSGDAFLIKKAKIRGAESEGMICAEDEIGLGESHAGIMILPADAVVGTLAKDFFNIPSSDFAIHIGLTPNRSDANSHIGVARDVCAYLTHHTGEVHMVKTPSVSLPEKSGTPLHIKISVSSAEACPRYMGLTMTGLKIGPSPEWLQRRLQTIGVRSINNVVDITNYVLHEYGQPLHAFDADRIKGQEVRVGFEAAGTLFTTLDGKERKLQDSDLMICDAEEGMCIAGVFGGMHSGITDGTTNIFLESAYFDPKHIRRTSLHHGLRTDAATHFEKGVDINNLQPALVHAAALIAEIAGGVVAGDLQDIYPSPFRPQEVSITYSHIEKLSGKGYPAAAVKQLLTALGFGIVSETEAGLTLTVPSNKADVSQPADIVEEVLRMDGLDNVKIPERLNVSLVKAMPNDRAEREKMATFLCGSGFQEIVTNSIVNSKYYPGRTDLVTMLNSLSSELDVMRPSMLESGLEVIAYNSNRKSGDLLLFEAGNIYRQEAGSYVQDAQLALFAAGNVQAAGWNIKSIKADIYYLKGVIQNLLHISGIKNTPITAEEHSITWKWKNQELCKVMNVAAATLNAFDIKGEVCYAVINWALWLKAIEANKIRFTEVPKFPAVQRDLAIVLDKTVSYLQVQQATDKLKLNALQSYGLFDVFESDKLGAGKKSLALNYTFQLQDRTLTDEETETLMTQLVTAYQKDLGAQIRN
jgi:phenylalanyl-tRNA synthetase beta chain